MSLRYLFLLLLFLNIGAGNELWADAAQGGSPAERGRWLAQAVEDRDTGRDARLALRMRLYDRQNRVRERALTVVTLTGGPGRPVPEDRTLIRFTHPADIDGTGLLVWEQPTGDAERFLYLPALGRVRRIAGSEAQENFVGSDFTYEDIGGRELETYDYAMVDEAATWKGADGVAHAAYRLESRHRDKDARFPRVVSTIRKDNFVVVRAEIHNRRDELQKVFEARRVELRGRYWTVTDMVMTDANQRTRTELVVERADYDLGLTIDDVSRRALERGARGRP
jgi:hypothetical protein